MTSSAAPSNHRREDYASSHPQHLLHHTQEAIPSSDSEPLSVRDGFIPFSIGNSSIAKEQSRNTFYNLIGHDAEANPPIIIADKPKKKNRKPGRRKPALSGRTQALQILLEEPTEQRCEGQKFKQRVRVAGCLTKTIINRFCFGTCASYFIPRMSTNKLKAFFKSCSTCGPKEYDSVNVTLDCPGQDPPQVTQSIIKVKKCACINVDLNS